jgi:hypothetical protein
VPHVSAKVDKIIPPRLCILIDQSFISSSTSLPTVNHFVHYPANAGKFLGLESLVTNCNTVIDIACESFPV